MADNNMRIWDALSKTDPKHTKPFNRAGGFKGTATKPIWLTMRLTEHFGPAGTGWGMTEPDFQVVPAGDEILVFCTVALWYGDLDHRVYGVGGDKVMGKNKYGPFTNDEAFKASYTDALSNAMKQIGVAADIHMGLFDDQKYVREVTQEFADHPGSAQTKSLSVDPADQHMVKGDGRSQYQVDKERKEIATLKSTAELAIGMAQTRLQLKEWWTQHKAVLYEKLEEDDYANIVAMVTKRRDELPELERVL